MRAAGNTAVDRTNDASLINGQFRFLSCLGAGGMGSVYLARYLGGCQVAVKLVKHMPDDKNGQELEDRFERECRILMGLRHPSIVTAFTHGRIQGTSQRFLVLEYVEGRTLAEHRRALGRPLTPAEATSLLLPIADALGYCHANRIYHRDLSPKNVLVVDGPDGAQHAKLVDFGASWQDEEEKLTKGVIFGNIDFQPLERFQRETQKLDPTRVGMQVDLFGLAAIAYYLTGGAGSSGALLDIHQKVGAEPLVIEGEPEWSALLQKAISRERGDHFADLAAFERAMRPFHPNARVRSQDDVQPWWVRDRPERATSTSDLPSTLGGELRTMRRRLSVDEVVQALSPVARLALFLLVFTAAFTLGLVST